MTIFSRIFEKRPVAIASAPSIDKALFIEESEPVMKSTQETFPKAKVEERTLLEQLLGRDYTLMGERDGYAMHHLDRMDMELSKIAADFRQVYDMAIQDIETQIGDLEKYLSDRVAAETPGLYEQMQSRHDQLARQKQDILLQKDFAMTGEGYVERAFQYYKSGFHTGFALYAGEKSLFKHTKTL